MLRLVLLSFLLLPLLAFAPKPVYILKGKAVRIIDGDTFDLLVGTINHRVRLAGIDAPEKKQEFSDASKQLLGQLCNGQVLTVVVTDTDRNKRKIAEVYTQQKLWINKELVVKGMAWHFTKYSSNKELANAELQARKQKLGLWSVVNPVAPWDWRKKK
ncbi:thermonuclease family protein [Lacibacter sediminis]|uniref:Thermonuclease family protein n=1 Tax=Lacibacter sediminis TaxID=2760713 RepID=A0A7G5XFF1_9BACT|nr:thermonuclease family protein [Lacibacter sediminis]QNA44204.1 thermonuclease family protein [Lacibacter sediminis]